MATRPRPETHDVERAFSEALAVEGFLPGPVQANTDDFVRFDAPGDKPGRRNGFYKLFADTPYPVGWFGDWKQGQHHEWHYVDPNAPTLTDDERSRIKKEQRRLKAEAQIARETRQAEVAEDASRMWGRASADVAGHPYLVAKEIEIPRSIRLYQAKDGTKLLLVPMFAFDMNGQPQLTNLQMIGPKGDKRFLKAGRVGGTFFSLKGSSDVIVLCEGYATGTTIWQATGLSVVVCFNAGNLIEVAKEFARWRPKATLLIAGDDDVEAPADWHIRGNGRAWVNEGAKKAEAAAKAVGCRWIVPYFQKGPGRNRTDFDDLRANEGLEAVSAQVLGAFKSIEAEDREPGAKIVDIEKVQDETWRSEIPRTSHGFPDGANVEGVALYIANHKLLRGRLRFNTLSRELELDGNALQDHHIAEFRRIMHSDGFKARKSDVQDEVEAEARRNSFDPLVEWLAGLKFDGTQRLDTWLPRYLGVEDSPYARVVGRRVLIGAVARAMAPGCKMDNMLVLEGEQNIGKSTAIRYLFGDRFFIDELPDFHSKDSFLQLQGAWCVEVAELSALTKADVKDVKKFLSRLVDKFRPPYGRVAIQVPRRTVFWGTVNPEEGTGYLKDPTGNRRFWPVFCNRIDLQAIIRDRELLWAEAVYAYSLGERWHLEDEDELKLATEEQKLRREVHPWEETISRGLSGTGTTTIAFIMNDILKIPPDKQDTRASRQVGACLRGLGWESRTERNGEKVAKVFHSPASVAAASDGAAKPAGIPGAIGPQEDAPF